MNKIDKLTRTKIPEGVTRVRNSATGDYKAAMPQTIEGYKALAQRDLELIMEQKAEISRLKQKVNKLEQRK